MKSLQKALVLLVVVGIVAAFGQRSTSASSTTSPHAEKAFQTTESSAGAKLRFAPLWIPMPKHGRPGEDFTAPAAPYAMIWDPQWQQELNVSAEQITRLDVLRAEALAASKKHSERFKSLPPEVRQAETKSWGGKAAPWRQRLDGKMRDQIEAVLTSRQLQTLKEDAFPMYAVTLLYEPDVRREIHFTPQQHDEFRRVAWERMGRLQKEHLKMADDIWALLTPQQKLALPELVRRQGPTSAALSLAFYLGFGSEFHLLSVGYPMLAAEPVRNRLALNSRQEQSLLSLMAENAELKRRDEPTPSFEAGQQQVAEILTPQQLQRLKEVDFRRKVVLALSYPEKRESIGMTGEQKAELQRLKQLAHDALYRIDREMLEKALAILTPAQVDQLRPQIERRVAGQ
jgi:hypothetical protein